MLYRFKREKDADWEFCSADSMEHVIHFLNHEQDAEPYAIEFYADICWLAYDD